MGNMNLTEILFNKCKQAKQCCVVFPNWLQTTIHYMATVADPWHPTNRDMKATQFLADVLKTLHGKRVLFMHSDVYMVSPFNFSWLHQFDLLTMPQGSGLGTRDIEHYWTGLLYMDFRRLSFKDGITHYSATLPKVPTDAGGSSFFHLSWLQAAPTAAWSFDYRTYPQRGSACNSTGPGQSMFNCTLMHLSGGSNWNYRKQDWHRNLEATVRALILSSPPAAAPA